MKTRLVAAGWLGLALGFMAVTGRAQPDPDPPFREDQIIIRPRAGLSPVALASAHALLRGEVLHTFPGLGRLQILRVPAGETARSLIRQYTESGAVEFAEPDYLVQADATFPNDPRFLDGSLWSLHNTGQSGGTADADIDAPEAWDVRTSASNIVVAILDTGIRLTHEDLASNLWTNPVDGSHGINVLTGTNNPADDNGHGSLMAGVLGGMGNNAKGVAGVAWRVQIMACKCLNSSATGSDSDVIKAIDFARTNGARIINASLDSSGYSLAMSNAIAAARAAGIIFVASSGNSALNVDLSPRYPACYDLDNIVSVAYTTRTDALGNISNYGATNVDLAAPGDAIYSTFFASDTSYLGNAALKGTSYAAAYVSGALALMLAQYPDETYLQIIRRLLSATDPIPALAGKCATGGRLNLRRALNPPARLVTTPTPPGTPFPLRLAADSNRVCVIEASTNLTNWVAIFTNTTSPAGTLDFRDDQATNTAARFYRGVPKP